jgi:hypothetical protein
VVELVPVVELVETTIITDKLDRRRAEHPTLPVAERGIAASAPWPLR